jgi:hypothetical protein
MGWREGVPSLKLKSGLWRSGVAVVRVRIAKRVRRRVRSIVALDSIED